MNETALQLPDRVGAKPETGPTIPHLQHSDISPPQVRDQLRAWARTAFEATTYGRSGVSVPSSEAYFLVYAPRTIEEIEILKTVFEASYRYATTGA